jgi:predicted amidohydrolase YtcJ
MGQGWNETDWTEPHMPTRETLDRAAPNHPVLLWRCDLHLAAANTPRSSGPGSTPARRTRRKAGSSATTRGVPTGILRELAINLVRQAVAKPNSDEVTAGL